MGMGMEMEMEMHVGGEEALFQEALSINLDVLYSKI
jgi:hypothetical protein